MTLFWEPPAPKPAPAAAPPWTLARVVAPHFVAGLEYDERGIVRRTAPILRWAAGKHWVSVSISCERKGWAVEILT